MRGFASPTWPYFFSSFFIENRFKEKKKEGLLAKPPSLRQAGSGDREGFRLHVPVCPWEPFLRPWSK
jgi:hypothetical protein